MAYLITYDLVKPGQDYSSMFEAIKRLGPWYKCLYSTWIVDTNESVETIAKTLRQYMDQNDKLLVIRVAPNWYAYLDEEGYNWMRQHIQSP